MNLGAAVGIAVVTLPLAVGCGTPTGPTTGDRDATGTAETPGATGIPAEYVLVGPSGGRAFAFLPVSSLPVPISPPSTVARAAPTRVEPGFGFVVTESRSHNGTRYVRLADGRWLPADDVIPVQPSRFAGAPLLRGEPLRFGWVISFEATIRLRPHVSAPEVTTRRFHTRLSFSGPCKEGWCPVTAGWVRASDLAIPTVSSPPEKNPTMVAGTGASSDNRWLDVDLASQTLVAYQGERPVYATLISAGIGQPGSPLATPTGVFSIRSKQSLVRMDNLEHTGIVPYSYDVPLAQYFADGKALHAALWHDRFGRASSHGCINLAPQDAAWLYRFTDPAVPTGTPQVRASPTHPGTIVRIHGILPTATTIVRPRPQ